MKRYIPVLVFVLAISSLGTWVTGASASTPLTRTMTIVGTSGVGGTATLTATGIGLTSTQINITALLHYDGSPGPASMPVGIYSGYCNGSMFPGALLVMLAHNASGTTPSSSTVSYTLSDLSVWPGDSMHPHYAIVVTDSNKNILSCVDVGMPSVNYPKTRVLTFNAISNGSSVIQPSYVVESLYGDLNQLRVTISLSGNSGKLTNLPYSAYVRPGSCAFLTKAAPPLYQLNNVIAVKDPDVAAAGTSVTVLPLGLSPGAPVELPSDSFLPSTLTNSTISNSPLAITVEVPKGPPGSYLACADITSQAGKVVPGMPKTGSASPSYTLLPLMLGALGLVMLVLGLRLTRRPSRRTTVSKVRKE